MRRVRVRAVCVHAGAGVCAGVCGRAGQVVIVDNSPAAYRIL